MASETAAAAAASSIIAALGGRAGARRACAAQRRAHVPVARAPPRNELGARDTLDARAEEEAGELVT